MQRIGCGFDVHKFGTGRKLVLGGETIEYKRGLTGHSDADVLLHALCDALLGAVAKGDIGQHFPPSDPQYKGISSMLLLKQIISMLEDDHWNLVNADITIICEEPKIAPYAERIRQNIARICGTLTDVISVKGTTTETLGFTGRGEGIAAMAVVLVEK